MGETGTPSPPSDDDCPENYVKCPEGSDAAGQCVPAGATERCNKKEVPPTPPPSGDKDTDIGDTTEYWTWQG